MSRPGPRGDKSGCGALRWLTTEPSPDPQHQPPPPARTMSRPRSFAPGSPLLLLLLLAACAALCRDAPMACELRCQCLQTQAAVIPPKRIANVELIPGGPHCGVPEVIATTKHGREVCLEPTAPWVKLIVTKILNRYLPGGCRCLCCASGQGPIGPALLHELSRVQGVAD
ncbi:growth-regulated alpha protein-like [Emys orbicularis]|uniref:growth-regulated alpha protein-like n=1 Tax=Emys orbicularis TaxID=82168 RepID=UPI0031FC7802